MGIPSKNIKQKKPMTEKQKVDWLYYAIEDLIVNSLDYNRERMGNRIALLKNGVKKVVSERVDNPGIFIKDEYRERHEKVVKALQSANDKMTEAWQYTWSMKNSEACIKLREARDTLGELIRDGMLYDEL